MELKKSSTIDYKNLKIIFLILFCFYFCSCENPSYYYYADLSIQNNTIYKAENIFVEYQLVWNDEYEILSFPNLSINEKSEYTKIKCGYQFIPGGNGVSSFTTIKEMSLSYTLNGVSMSNTIFDDGLCGEYVFSPDSLTEEQAEKVYIMNDTQNTILIKEDGVGLLKNQ